MTKTTAEAAKKAELKERYLAYLAAETWQTCEKMIDYNRKKISQVVELDNGELVAIDKPNIETNFCFGYSNNEYAEAEKMKEHAETHADYFINENLRRFDKEYPEWLKNKPDTAYIQTRYINAPENTKIKDIVFLDYWTSSGLTDEEKKKIRKLSPAEIEKLLTAYAEERAIFEKRLYAYLKRYGTEKLNCWTYWRDE